MEAETALSKLARLARHVAHYSYLIPVVSYWLLSPVLLSLVKSDSVQLCFSLEEDMSKNI
jgi:hypothetical protein